MFIQPLAPFRDHTIDPSGVGRLKVYYVARLLAYDGKAGRPRRPGEVVEALLRGELAENASRTHDLVTRAIESYRILNFESKYWSDSMVAGKILEHFERSDR